MQTADRFQTFSFIFPQRHVPLHAMIAGCGRQRISSVDYDWDGRKRGKTEFTIFQYTLAGLGMLEYEGRTMEVGRGTAMLLNLPHRHRYWWPAGNPPWEFIYLVLYGREVIRLSRLLQSSHGPLIPLKRTLLPVVTASHIERAAARGQMQSEFAVSSLAYEFMMALSSTLLDKVADSPAPQMLQHVKAYCETHFREGIGVDDMARHIGLSCYHFSRVFKAGSGLSPGIFLREIRLREALRLLRETQLPVKAVAEESGFCDISYFCRAFRKFAGVTPGSFRSGGVY